MTSLWYKYGTVDVTNGSVDVQGNSVTFLAQAKAGDLFTIDRSTFYEITAIPTETTLKIAPAYQETSQLSVPYFIIRNFTSTTNADLAARIAEFIRKWQVREEELFNWQAGTVDGGPNADGTYPITNFQGGVAHIMSPAKMETYVGDAQQIIDDLTADAAAAQTAATTAQNSITYAQEWADANEDVLISASAGGNTINDYSALHHAAKAALSAQSASADATSISGQLQAATDQVGFAQEWAGAAPDVPISLLAGGNTIDDYSSKHHAYYAEQSAAAASGHNDTATQAALDAQTYRSQSEGYHDAALNYRNYAEEWANAAENLLISSLAGGDQVDDYSAKHHATKAAASAGSANSNASSASIHAGNALTYRDAALGYRDEAAGYRTQAQTAEGNASTHATNASNSAGTAGTSASNAINAQSYSQQWAIRAEDSAVTIAAGGDGSTTFSAFHHAQKAAASATSALNDRTSAEEWANAAEDVLISSAAGGDQIGDYSAKHHATKAADSAVAANSDASSSAINAADALAYRDTTLGYRDDAAGYRTQAQTAEGNASNSAGAASTSETNAINAQSYSQQWAIRAEDSAVTIAAGGDGSTTFSAFHHAQKAAASVGVANERLLGGQASAPTTDLNGAAITEGALYFNTTDNNFYVYNGAAWIATTSEGKLDTSGGALTGDLDLSNNSVLNAAAINGITISTIYHSGNTHSHLIADLPVAADGEVSTTKLVRSDDSRLTVTADHTHEIADVTNLQNVLDDKATINEKGTTGDPVSGINGEILINSVDSSLKIWANGEWIPITAQAYDYGSITTSHQHSYDYGGLT